eukprot:4188014-Prymnesium_polylepis.1
MKACEINEAILVQPKRSYDSVSDHDRKMRCPMSDVSGEESRALPATRPGLPILTASQSSPVPPVRGRSTGTARSADAAQPTSDVSGAASSHKRQGASVFASRTRCRDTRGHLGSGVAVVVCAARRDMFWAKRVLPSSFSFPELRTPYKA